jgi:uncharacterized protein DUF4157
MATLADLFKTCYLTSGNRVEFADIRLHYRGVDEICHAFGAAALTIGSDIYFRREAFAPHTPRGLRQLAEIGEVLEVDALGRRCGFAPWKLYSSAVGRNAGHFAPFS